MPCEVLFHHVYALIALEEMRIRQTVITCRYDDGALQARLNDIEREVSPLQTKETLQASIDVLCWFPCILPLVHQPSPCPHFHLELNPSVMTCTHISPDLVH